VASTEAERRTLPRDETAALASQEIADRLTPAVQYGTLGHPDRAARLRREAQAIQSALEDAADLS
jgi:hypothetical protein